MIRSFDLGAKPIPNPRATSVDLDRGFTACVDGASGRSLTARAAIIVAIAADNAIYGSQRKSTQRRRHFEACKLRLRLAGRSLDQRDPPANGLR
jgi:hypothetical protein